MLNRVFIGIVFFLISFQDFAQRVLPSDKTEFGNQVKELLVKTGKEAGETTGDEFISVFGSMTSDVQQKVMSQSQLIIDKRYKIYPLLNEYYKSLTNAVNFMSLSPDKLLEYLDMTDGVLNNMKQAEVLRYFKNMSLFFEHNALYHSAANKVYTTGSEFTFEYVGAVEIVDDTYTDYEEPAADTTYSDSNWDDGGWDYNWDDQSTTETQDTSDPNYDPWAETQSTYEEPEPIDP
ncbi:MAG: hypothetical protein OEW75_12600, partial [Cyclobacteriaceae bacterium]|nr:hypothetical protein [Cyclobacteriaceae bacterium]